MKIKNILFIGLLAVISAGCVVVDDTPPAPRNYPMFYRHGAYSPRPHHRPRPMYDRAPMEQPAAKHPQKPGAATPPNSSKRPSDKIPGGASKRVPPPTVR